LHFAANTPTTPHSVIWKLPQMDSVMVTAHSDCFFPFPILGSHPIAYRHIFLNTNTVVFFSNGQQPRKPCWFKRAPLVRNTRTNIVREFDNYGRGICFSGQIFFFEVYLPFLPSSSWSLLLKRTFCFFELKFLSALDFRHIRK